MRYTLAKLSKSKTGNDWYVYYRFENPVTGEMKLFKDRGDINRIKDKKQRKRAGENLSQAYNNKFENGFSPFLITETQKQINSTLFELLDEFLKIKKTSLRRRSYQHYKYAVDLIKEYLGKSVIKPGQFTKPMAHGFADFLLTKKGMGNKSHNNHIASISTFFSMMIEREIIVKNPFKSVKKKPVDVGKNIAYSEVQRIQIKAHLEETQSPLLMMVQFIYYCFIRPNELMQLQVKHINFKGKQIQIPANISKNRNQSSVEIPDKFFEEVKNKYEKLNPEFYLFGKGLTYGLISVHRNRASAAHKKVLEALEISSVHTLYSWKHTGAIAAIESGMNPYTLMRQLRHSSLDQTMIYLKTLGLTTNSEFSLKMTEF